MKKLKEKRRKKNNKVIINDFKYFNNQSLTLFAYDEGFSKVEKSNPVDDFD